MANYSPGPVEGLSHLRNTTRLDFASLTASVQDAILNSSVLRRLTRRRLACPVHPFHVEKDLYATSKTLPQVDVAQRESEASGVMAGYSASPLNFANGCCLRFV
jgi:hypothetical protein